MIQTPVAYIIFNRPSLTKKSFSVLQKNQPSQLFIIADGPRSGHPKDEKKCAEVRKIVEQINWPCKVYHNYAKTNLGLKQRVSSGLNWVFDNVERAIVIEDDCVAHQDFFHFCDVLLEHYADDEKISLITGDNFQKGNWRGEASYYFSKYAHCWGWATWRRSWKNYQEDITFWPKWKNSDSWQEQMPDKIERKYWTLIFDRVAKGQIDSWAYPWTASVWYNGGLTVTPNMNLVSNIGFGEDSSHTLNKHSIFSNMPLQKLGELKHPKKVEKDLEADSWTFNFHFGGKNLRFPNNLTFLPRRVIGYIYRKFK